MTDEFRAVIAHTSSADMIQAAAKDAAGGRGRAP